MQRHALVVLFALLAGAFAAVAGDALQGGTSTRRLLVGIVAAVIALWLASLSFATVRRSRR